MKAPDAATVTFDGDGLVVAIAQDSATGTVLIVGYMNRAALTRTVASGQAHFWSRRRNALWRKGETSGNVLHVEAIQTDCDADALLLSVHPAGPTCHTGRRACFAEPATVLDLLATTLRERKSTRPPGSHTVGLFADGREAILRKIGEEAVEVILAGSAESDKALVGEVADLWFHSLVLLADRGLGPADVLRVLAQRRRAMTPSV